MRCGREEIEGRKKARACRRKNARALCSAGVFVERHPAAHLIAGRMPQDKTPGAQLVGPYQECASRRPFHQDCKTRKVIAAALDGVE